MPKEDARVTVGADASAVERAAGAAKNAWKEAGEAIASSFGSATRQVVASLGEVVLAQGRINFASQHQQVRDFESTAARLAVAMGRDFGQVKSSLEATAVAIGEQPKEVAAWVQSVGQLTYSFQGAMDSLGGIRQLAAATGRSIGDYRGLAVELVNIGKVGGDASRAIGVIARQAEILKTQGGVAAFADQIEGLSGLLSKVSIKSEKDFLRITALIGALGQGLAPAQAKIAQQQALGPVLEEPDRWRRFLGHRLVDEHGRMKGEDVVKVLTNIVDENRSRRGSAAQAAFVLSQSQNLGQLGGMAAANLDRQALQAAIDATPSTAPSAALAKFQETASGRREVAAAELSVSSAKLLDSSSALGKAADALQQFAAKNPLTSTFATTFAGGLTAAVTASITTAMRGAAGGVGSRLLAGGGAGLGTLAGLAPVALTAAAVGVTQYGAQKFETETERVFQEQEEAGVELHRAKLLTQKKQRQRRVRELEATGVAHGTAVYQAEQEQKAGTSTQDLAKFAQMIVDGLQKAKFQVVTRPDTPVEVTAQTQQSAAAGGQHGG